MRRLWGRATTRAVTVTSAVAVSALLALPAGAAASCHPGVHKFGSGQARTFCGKARATVVRPGSKVTLRGGSCKRTSNYFTINIGTVVLTPGASNPPAYFGLTVGKPVGSQPAGKDGTYVNDAAIAFVIKHKRYAVMNPTVVLKDGRTRGSFSGTLLSGGKVSGTFHC